MIRTATLAACAAVCLVAAAGTASAQLPTPLPGRPFPTTPTQFPPSFPGPVNPGPFPPCFPGRGHDHDHHDHCDRYDYQVWVWHCGHWDLKSTFDTERRAELHALRLEEAGFRARVQRVFAR
jgi:hypothetical protein